VQSDDYVVINGINSTVIVETDLDDVLKKGKDRARRPPLKLCW
jgi:hypothetical protein